MEWNQLSVRDRARFIKQMVSLGITTSKEQEDFFNRASKNGHKFDGDPTKEDVRAAEVEQAFKNAMRTRSFDPYFGQTSGFSYNVFPNSFQKQEDANVPMSWGVSLDVPIVKSARVGEMPNDPHDDYYGSLDLYAKNAYPNGFKWNLSGNYTKGGTAQDDIMSIQGGVGYRHIPTGLFGEFSAGYNKTGNPLHPNGFTTSGSIGYSRNIGEKQELKRQKAEALLKEIAEERKLQEKQNNEKALGGHLFDGFPLNPLENETYEDYVTRNLKLKQSDLKNRYINYFNSPDYAKYNDDLAYQWDINRIYNLSGVAKTKLNPTNLTRTFLPTENYDVITVNKTTNLRDGDIVQSNYADSSPFIYYQENIYDWENDAVKTKFDSTISPLPNSYRQRGLNTYIIRAKHTPQELQQLKDRYDLYQYAHTSSNLQPVGIEGLDLTQLAIPNIQIPEPIQSNVELTNNEQDLDISPSGVKPKLKIHNVKNLFNRRYLTPRNFVKGYYRHDLGGHLFDGNPDEKVKQAVLSSFVPFDPVSARMISYQPMVTDNTKVVLPTSITERKVLEEEHQQATKIAKSAQRAYDLNQTYLYNGMSDDKQFQSIQPKIQQNNKAEYVVQAGDSLYNIAKQLTGNGENYKKLAEENGIKDVNRIYPGMKIQYTAPQQTSFATYTVKKGDNFSRIARSHGVDMNSLIKANPHISNINNIMIGQKLRIPQSMKTEAQWRNVDEEQAKELEINKNNLNAILNSHHDSPYAVMDKKSGTFTIYDANNNVMKQFNGVVTGKSGNDYNTVTYSKDGQIISGAGNESTPAGITVVSSMGTYHGSPSFQRARYDSDTGNFRTFMDSEGNVRPDDIASSIHYGPQDTSGNLYLSNGCIRMTPAQLSELSNYINVGTKIYTLPTNDKSRFEVRDGKLNFFADDPYGSQDTTGNNQYDSKNGYALWDDYNTTRDFSASPIKIKWNRDEETVQNRGEEYYENLSSFANKIVNDKENLMNLANSTTMNGEKKKSLKIDSDTYNKLAKMSFGLVNQESHFGTGARYTQFKKYANYARDIANYVGGYDRLMSRGVAQMKIEGDNPEMQKYYDALEINPHNLQYQNTDVQSEYAADAIMMRLMYIYANEVRGKEFYDAYGNKMNWEDALVYIYAGQKYKLGKTKDEGLKLGVEKGATPETNKHIKAIKDMSNKIQIETFR